MRTKYQIILVVGLLIVAIFLFYLKINNSRCIAKLFGSENLAQQYSFEKIESIAKKEGYQVERDNDGSFAVRYKIGTKEAKDFTLYPPTSNESVNRPKWDIGVRYFGNYCSASDKSIKDDAKKFLDLFEVESNWISGTNPKKWLKTGFD